MFFRLTTWELWLIIAAVVLGFVALGYLAGRVLRGHLETLREPVGVVQGALLALVGLVLAFGLSLAIGRYDSRRAAVVDDANTIGTTYLRAQTLSEPTRSRSLELLKRYTDASLQLSDAVPTTAKFRQAIATEDGLQRQLWRLAGNALKGAPQDSAPRLYVETLNEMIDQQTVRVAALNNRIPNAVLALEVFGAAIAFGLLALYTAMHGRGATTVILACLFWELVWGLPGLFLAMPLMAGVKAICAHVPGWRPWANLMGTEKAEIALEKSRTSSRPDLKLEDTQLLSPEEAEAIITERKHSSS